jgi:metallophosphoesterase superfamily enzyme
MNEMNEDDFFMTKFSFAIVIRGDLKTIQKLKEFLSDEQIQIIYQKTSTNKLIITEGEHE